MHDANEHAPEDLNELTPEHINEHSAFDFDLGTTPIVPDLTVTEPDAAAVAAAVDEWAPVDPDALNAHLGNPLTETFTDIDLEPARAPLPVEFDEDFWSVES